MISSNCNVVLNNGLIDDSNLTHYGGRHRFDCLASTLGASLAWNMCALKCRVQGGEEQDAGKFHDAGVYIL